MDSWFANPESRVSAHYGVGKDGTIHQYVDEEHSAWHCGITNRPTWSLLNPYINQNQITIGIEHVGWTGEEWTDSMYRADAFLVKRAAERWGFPVDELHVIEHAELDSVTRNRCPGAGFSKQRLLEMLR